MRLYDAQTTESSGVYQPQETLRRGWNTQEGADLESATCTLDRNIGVKK